MYYVPLLVLSLALVFSLVLIDTTTPIHGKYIVTFTVNI